jgi:hypothetical protein
VNDPGSQPACPERSTPSSFLSPGLELMEGERATGRVFDKKQKQAIALRTGANCRRGRLLDSRRLQQLGAAPRSHLVYVIGPAASACVFRFLDLFVRWYGGLFCWQLAIILGVSLLLLTSLNEMHTLRCIL